MEPESQILDYLALMLMVIIFTVIPYGIIAIHDIPYNIAKKRNHPHIEAIHAAGLMSLFTLHVIWPFIWIWAYLFTGSSKINVALELNENGNKQIKEHLNLDVDKTPKTEEEDK